MVKNANGFKQDAWTSTFCEKFRELRKARIIRTNGIFADEVGLHQTGLSHILRGCRDFPHAHRVLADEVLSRYQADKGLLEKITCEGHKIAPLTDGHSTLKVEILVLERQMTQLQKEIDQLQDEVIKLQTLLIERLEYINELNND